VSNLESDKRNSIIARSEVAPAVYAQKVIGLNRSGGAKTSVMGDAEEVRAEGGSLAYFIAGEL